MAGARYDNREVAREAMEDLLRRIVLNRLTGEWYIAVNSNQGGVTNVRVGRVEEEDYKPKV